jgi:hypothetical protein
MRQTTPRLTFAAIFALLLVGCSGGSGGGNSSGGGAPNVAPVANAGPAQSVTSGAAVTLNGTASSDSDGTVANYTWTQTAGTAVTLTNGNSSQPTFTAPTVGAATTLTFSLQVRDNRGASSAQSTVNVTVDPPANVAPTANAGANQTVNSGVTVTLNGGASSDSDGTIATHVWTQTAGSAVTLTNGATSQPTFTAPTVASATTLTFSLAVTDNRGASSAADTVDITVNPAIAGNVNVTGTVTFGRVMIAAATRGGLLYGTPVQQPSRGVLVRALDATTLAVLATGSTSATGTYSLSVPTNTSIRIELVARMVSNASPALPRWNVRVQNGDDTAGDTPYTYMDGVAFNSSAGTPHNIAIPTGISAGGIATGPRDSGPFAILDTVYQGIQTVIGVAPNTSFPDLILAWGSNVSLGTYFSAGTPQFISLLSTLTADTDEFDQHVIAHEFGHYIEFNFSRADNIGGQHTFGEKIDPRVAFGEGFGYAFAGIVLDNTDARDTYTDNGVSRSTQFNIEANPRTNPVGPDEDYGCWCSETSMYSIIWDLYDSAADANDTVALGFAPIWSVLINEQRTTPAYTTIFPFVTALKAARPGDASAINTLLAAQNINGTDAWGTGETHVPTSVPGNVALPLYTTITRGGGAVTLRTVNDEGVDNKLGNHRFLRFTPSASGSVTVSLSTTNSTNDPDFTMKRSGTYVLNEVDQPPGPETGTTNVTNGTTYVLDVYDCDNGCPGSEEVGGDFDLTVTIN